MAKKQSKLVKLGRAVTPKGTAAWAYLTEPAETYGGDDVEQKITIFMKKKAEDFAPFLAVLNDARKALAKEKGCKPADVILPIKTAQAKHVDKVEGVEEGDPYIEFKTKPKFTNGVAVPVAVVDAKAKPTDEEVWGGDIVRVQFNMSGWEMPSPRGMQYGIKCYLSGVQLLQSNKSGGGGVDLFDADEAFANDEGDTPDIGDLPEEDDGGFDFPEE